MLRPILRADPFSRVAVLLLPATGSLSNLAVLPLYTDQAEVEASGAHAGSLPYAPSFVLELATISPRLRNVVDMAFLPGFNEATLAILYCPAAPSWVGMLETERDACRLAIVTLDLAAAHYPIILDGQSGLPSDCQRVIPCPRALGGVLVLSANAVFHIDVAGKITGKPANGWHAKQSGLVLGPPTAATPNLRLEGAQIAFLDAFTASMVLENGQIWLIRFTRDGRTLSSLDLVGPVAVSAAPSAVEIVGREFLFVASAVGDSALLRFRAAVPKTAEDGAASDSSEDEETMVTAGGDDADLYGSSARDKGKGRADEASGPGDYVLELCDGLAATGAIRDMAMGLIADDVRRSTLRRR